MLRHAEMPKGSRQAPTSTDGFILGPVTRHSGSASLSENCELGTRTEIHPLFPPATISS